ncbi:MAG: bifunctional serine/threonine-protein kinase/formylglycine-generating enzyme family protein [Planctomycetota bacterium]
MTAPNEEQLILRLVSELAEADDAEIERRLREAAVSRPVHDRVVELLSFRDRSMPFGLTPEEIARHTEVGSMIPKKIDGFEIESVVSRGGMGIVCRAHDHELGRPVALKLLTPGALRTPREALRFRLEARAAAKLEHPHIVRVYRVGQGSEFDYIAMEFIEGGTLRDLLTEGAPEPHDAHARAEWCSKIALLLAKVCDALGEAHARGIVHRDVKPSNILLKADGEPKLADFGLAKDTRSDLLETVSGELAGTVKYMSPERLAGGSSGRDPRSDLFAIGVVLVECLSGRHPFEGDSHFLIADAIRSVKPSRIDAMLAPVDPRLRRIACKATERDPDRRYQTAPELAADLRAWAAGENVRAPRPRRPIGPVILGLVAAASVSVALGLAILAQIADGGDQSRPDRSGSIELDGLPDPSAWSLAIRPIDASTGIAGEWRLLDGILIETDAIEPGHYLICTFREGELIEWTRYLTRGHDERLMARAEPPDEVGEMILVDPAAARRTAAPPNQIEAYLRFAADIDPFMLDRTEVSNREYQRFLEATGHPPPPHWDDLPGEPGWLDLPVVGVGYEDARSFAEWAGKRLPTAAEFMAAGRWPDGRPLPWDTAEAAGEPFPIRVALGGLPSTDPGSQLVEGFPDLAGHLAGVLRPASGIEAGLDRSELGFVHLLGNVAEWSATLQAGLDEDHRVVMGSSWTAWHQPSLASRHARPMDQKLVGLGFRCARSVNPPRPMAGEGGEPSISHNFEPRDGR